MKFRVSQAPQNCGGNGILGYPATLGYDQATGVGSIDANNLAIYWSTAPLISFSATNLMFAAQIAGSTSAPQTVTLTNTGKSAPSISGITASQDFAQTNTCGTSIPVASTCTISITYKPTVLGPETGSISIAETSPGTPLTINLAGSAISAISLSPASLAFAPQLVGTTSAPQTMTFTNSGPSPVTIYYIAAGNDFSETNNCGASVPPAGSCTITIAFRPISSGSQSGSMLISDSAIGAPQMASFTASAFSAVFLSPASLAFGKQLAGIASANQTAALTNVGSVPLNITGFEAYGSFAQTNTCGASIAVGGTCTISVNFKPSAIGPQTGAIILTDNEFDSPQYLNLSGTGVSTVSLSPPSLTFPSQLVNTTSAPQIVTLTNVGNTALTITSIAASGNFAETNTCGPSIPPAGACAISATFTPASTLILPAMLTITDNAIGSPQNLNLQGSAFTDVVLSANTVTFAAIPLGGTSLTTTVNVTNAAATPLTISSIAITGTNSGDFAQVNNCPPSLAAGATCKISASFQPSTLGVRNATIAITDNATDSPQMISLQAEGADFSLATEGSATATVTAGQQASYSLQLNPTQNLAGPVAMACTGAPAQTTCTVTPANTAIDGSPISFQVSVTTTVRSSLPARLLPNLKLRLPPPAIYFETLLLLLLLTAATSAGRRSTTVRFWTRFAIVLICATTLLIACGGGNTIENSETTTSVNTGTPAGSYNLMVTATQSGATRFASLSLTVN
jgi:hypothetical protein